MPRSRILFLFASLLTLVSCGQGLPDAELQDIRQQILSLDRSVSEDEAYLRDAAAYHHAWLLQMTDSATAPAASAKYRQDSSFHARVDRQARRFDQWFTQYLLRSRQMRMQVSEMRQWLKRQEVNRPPVGKTQRSFTAHMEEFLKSSRAYRAAPGLYEQVKAGYTQVPRPL